VSQLFSQLGINGGLLLSQAVNFSLVLIVLYAVLYKPLLGILRSRRERIEEGLMKAKEADERLKEVDQIGKKKIKEAEDSAVGILKDVERKAKELEEKMIADAKRKEAVELKNAAAALRVQEDASRRAMEKEASAFVRAALAKTVELSPAAIDDALIAKAVRETAQKKEQ
jgi:F-type H+-transporting ATPase subunit b